MISSLLRTERTKWIIIINISLFFLLLYDTAGCVFNIGFILLMCSISLIISLKLLSALTIISMSEASIMCPEFYSLWQSMDDSLFLPLWSLLRRASMRSVLPMYISLHVWHFILYTTNDCSFDSFMLSLKGNFFPVSFEALKATVKSICSKLSLTSLVSLGAKFSAL